MPLSADERRALAMLATLGRDGVEQALLGAHGFDASMVAELVNQGMATIAAEKVRADDGKVIAVAKVRITGAGQNALMAEDSPSPGLAGPRAAPFIHPAPILWTAQKIEKKSAEKKSRTQIDRSAAAQRQCQIVLLRTALTSRPTKSP